jgi:hypothetical protein
MDDVEAAKETITRLEGKLAKATDRATALQTERRKLSFAAHNGDDSAQNTRQVDRRVRDHWIVDRESELRDR